MYHYSHYLCNTNLSTMNYQQTNQQKANNKAYAIKTASYDTNGIYVRRQNWNGMNWISKTKRLAIYLRDNLQCVYCGKTLLDNGIKLTLDHVKPASTYEGKATDEKNLVCCCTNCNFTKQDLTLVTFAKIIAIKTGAESITILKNVRNALARKIDTKQAGVIIKAQKNFTNTFTYLRNNK